MARVTVEDCLKNVDNRFELVLLSSKRARQLSFENAEPKVPRDNDKSPVIALREIAAGLVTKENIEAAPPIPTLEIEKPIEISSEIIAETQTAVAEETASSVSDDSDSE